MIKRYKIIIILVMLISVMLFMTACQNNATAWDEPEPSPTAGVVIPAAITSANGNDSNVTQLISIQYYTVDIDTYDLVTVAAMVPEGKKVTPEIIMEFFVDSMEDKGVAISISNITIKDDVITVDFTDKVYDIAKESDELEKGMLDAIAQSLLDNITECKSISFSIMNQAYNTVNISQELGYIYMGD